MRDAQPRTIYLKDYLPPAWLIDKTNLAFDLYEDHAVVDALLDVRKNPEGDASDELELDGQELELLSLEIDGRVLKESEFRLSDDSLHILSCPALFQLRVRTRIRPQENTALEGLYKSRTMFCTQCEAEGFRKITYYLDRPDVMSVFSVRVTADRDAYPILLSNGNKVDEGEEAGRHWSVWEDPFPKPSYLFALVAGDLACVADSFRTCSGREVDLRIYVENKDVDKCAHAMLALKNSMRWDEEVFGREYDLDIFNIVAVDDFNMGAMENKSLNIFNTSCVLAHPQTTSDAAFQRVEAVVAHEYFHNWSGNRVTCRDWFQLSLKEGFTVYRDAEFSSDMGSRTVKRVEDVSMLRSVQFAEDGGPMAHPVRPASFIEISNFYTVTIYEKGAEVVRMIRTLLGAEAFRRGSDLYFDRHDGCAVTCDDFVQAMEDASGRDLAQFRNWYSQAGTPHLSVQDSWDEQTNSYTLTISQSCNPTPGQASKQPFHIPVELGLLGDAGALRLQLAGEQQDTDRADNTRRVMELTESQHSYTFTNLPERPVPSLLRGFSAPVTLDYAYSRQQLAFLMANDEDGFCRWDAGQRLALEVVQECQDDTATVDEQLLSAFSALLSADNLDPAMVSIMWLLPTENYLAEQVQVIDVQAIHRGRERVRETLAQHCRPILLQRYHSLQDTQGYEPSAAQIASRSLRNRCLSYLALLGGEGVQLALEQFYQSSNMTDQQAALVSVVNCGTEAQREEVLAEFYQRWQHEPLVVNQWLQVQALCPQPGNVERVRALMDNPIFDMRNPNKVRSLIGGFCSANPSNFHRADGAGYDLLFEVVSVLNDSNPQIASRLLTPLTRWRRYGERSGQMQQALKKIAALSALSKDVFEVVNKSLAE